MSVIRGGCYCKKVRYQILAAPISSGICYCRQCQKTGGAIGSPLLIVRSEDFICGSEGLTAYETLSSRGVHVKRNFCTTCGSPVFAQIADVPNVITVKATTLDEPAFFAPDYQVWTQSAGVATSLLPNVPAFAANAPLSVLLKF